MTERQKFKLIEKIGSLEIRRYHPVVTAKVAVKGDYQSAGNQGFRPLANYIFSNNIAMTAPVIIEESPENNWEVSFVMPEGSKLNEMPTPSGNVKLNEHGEELCAVLSFSGFAGAKQVAKMEAQLTKELAKNNLTPIGKVRVARFDPPWKPGLFRHNELVVPIKY